MSLVACGLSLMLSGHALDGHPPAAPGVAWRRTLDGWGEPAVDGESAYLLTRSHQVVSLDLSDGQERWRVDTGGPGETPLGSAARLTANSVIVGDDAVIALDRRTGATQWRFVPPRGHGAGIFLGEVDDDLVVAGSSSGHVYALDSATGRLRWMRTVVEGPAGTVFQPLLAGGRVVVSYTTFAGTLGGGVAAFDRDGRRLWQVGFAASTGAAGPARATGRVVVVARTDGVVQAHALRDGRRRWSLPRARGGERLTRDIRPIVVVQDLLIAGSLTGTVTGYDLARRRVRWQFDSPDGAAALRLTSDGVSVFAPLTSGTLLALSAAHGAERWRTGEAPDRVGWPPAVSGRRVVAIGERSVVALEPGPGPEPASSASIRGGEP